MNPRQLTSAVLLSFLVLFAGCSSDRAPQGSSSLPSSAPANKSPEPAQTPAPPASSSPTQATAAAAEKPAEDSITYAKNPGRFRKYDVAPAPFNITDPKTEQEHFNVGVHLDNEKQYDKAIEEYRKALELKPNWGLAHFRMARDYERIGRLDDAIAHWEQTAKYDPQFYTTYDVLSAAYERKGDLPKAIETYSKMLAYPPAAMPVHYQVGLWYAQLGDKKNAREHLEDYRQLASKISAEKESPRFQKATSELKKLDR